jgi:hypothetical protein
MTSDDAAHRRLAVQLASQLPEDMDTCLAVLDYTRKIVTDFLHQGEQPERPRVVSIKAVEVVK